MIKLIKSTFYKEEETKKKLVDFILKSKKLSMGDEVRFFEKTFAKKQGRNFAVMVNSGSSANLVLIQALLNIQKLKHGDRVGFSSLTWPTNVMPLIQLGLEPIPLDCELNTLNVSSDILEKEIDNIDALFITNALGFASDLPKIKDICKEKGVLLLEDNAESLGSKIGDVMLGNFGLASTFSFFVGHHLSTVEGGMVCTDNEELYDALVMARAHGWNRNLSGSKREELRKRAGSDEFYDKYTFYDLAFNVRPSEINGFLGNVQVSFWDDIVSGRMNNFLRMKDAINNNPDLINLEPEHMSLISNFAVPIIVKNEDIFSKYLSKFQEKAEVRPIIAGDITKQPFYKKYSNNYCHCPNSDFIHKKGFYFGNNPEMDEGEISTLLSLIKNK